MSNAMNLSLHLKQETRRLHLLVDQHIVLKRLMLTNLSLEKYRVALSALYDWHQLISKSIEFSSIPIELFNHQEHVQRLKKDLQNIDEHSGDNAAEPPKICRAQDTSLTSTNSLGYFYVVQGSMLGGQHITRKVKQTISTEESMDVFQYFSGYKSETQVKWSQSCSFLNAQDLTPNERDDVVLSAQEAFSSLLSILNKYQSVELMESTYA